MLKRVETLDSSEAIVKQILELVRNGQLKAGDKLPTEAELVKLLGVGRSSVREAKRVLAAKGVIDMQPGRGTFVRELGVEVVDCDLLQALLAKETVMELQETREMLEQHIITLATQRATDEDLDKLESIVESMERASPSSQVYELSLDYHRALTSATHNRVLIALYNVIANLLMEYQMPYYLEHADSEQEVKDHRQILNAIRQRNIPLAQHLMTEHMAKARRFVQQYLS